MDNKYNLPIFGYFKKSWNQDMIDTLDDREKFLFNFYKDNIWYN